MMVGAVYIHDDLFAAGPPMRLRQTLRLVKAGEPHVARFAIIAVLVGWMPLALLAVVEMLISPGHPVSSFFSDLAVHARFLIAAPALILAEADCIPRLGRIVRQFVEADLIAGSDTTRFETAVLSTRRLLDSAASDVIATVFAYAVAVALIFYVSTAQFPEWYRGNRGGVLDLSLAGWWHALVSLPLLLILFLGWIWRLVLWARFLILMARLDLRLIPSHPDHAGGLKFVSYSLRGFRLISFAMGAVVAGSIANQVVHHGANPLDLKNYAIGLTLLTLIFFVAPLTVFLQKLRQTKERGVFEYSALAGYVGTQFETKWLKPTPEEQALKAQDFSATTDLYSVAANVYEMRDVPFGVKDLIGPVVAGLAPFIPVALLAVPLRVIIDRLVKLLL